MGDLPGGDERVGAKEHEEDDAGDAVGHGGEEERSGKCGYAKCLGKVTEGVDRVGPGDGAECGRDHRDRDRGAA